MTYCGRYDEKCHMKIVSFLYRYGKEINQSIINYITCYNYIQVSELLAVRNHDGYRRKKQQYQKIVLKSTLSVKCAFTR